ncbi:hypothetical protein DRW07_17735 [Alteromonas sediminis]|uniref:Uncharacterized protein n=1 Tax=Alteromonas sediminis TaxID=2259342 RepID=A0A3N5Z846_9ALTE|nr:hypothetical protein [Alteromonas sediminis]RPJ65148.1 hypothetical protein DRW07_17735 [Alteromonas sediminis]
MMLILQIAIGVVLGIFLSTILYRFRAEAFKLLWWSVLAALIIALLFVIIFFFANFDFYEYLNSDYVAGAILVFLVAGGVIGLMANFRDIASLFRKD